MDWQDILIGQNATISGEIKTQASIYLSGRIEGSVYTDKNVDIDDKGVVKGVIECIDYNLSGTHEGEVTAKKIHLTKTAKLLGDLTSSCLVIDEGAAFIGTSKKQREKLDSKIDQYEPIYEI